MTAINITIPEDEAKHLPRGEWLRGGFMLYIELDGTAFVDQRYVMIDNGHMRRIPTTPPKQSGETPA